MILRTMFAAFLAFACMSCAAPPGAEPADTAAPPAILPPAVKAEPVVIASLTYMPGYSSRKPHVDIAIWDSGLVIWSSPLHEGYCKGQLSPKQVVDARNFIRDLEILKQKNFTLAAIDGRCIEMMLRPNDVNREFGWNEYGLENERHRKAVEGWFDAKQLLMKLRPACGELVVEGSEEAKLFRKDLHIGLHNYGAPLPAK